MASSSWTQILLGGPPTGMKICLRKHRIARAAYTRMRQAVFRRLLLRMCRCAERRVTLTVPYSTQRSGRYSPESVESHKEFQVAMTDFMTWLTHMNPKAQVFEQVDGFFLPFDSKVSLETPFDRQDSKT